MSANLNYICDGFMIAFLIAELGLVVLLIISEITKKLKSKKVDDDTPTSSRGFYHIDIGIVADDDETYNDRLYLILEYTGRICKVKDVQLRVSYSASKDDPRGIDIELLCSEDKFSEIYSRLIPAISKYTYKPSWYIKPV